MWPIDLSASSIPNPGDQSIQLAFTDLALAEAVRKLALPATVRARSEESSRDLDPVRTFFRSCFSKHLART